MYSEVYSKSYATVASNIAASPASNMLTQIIHTGQQAIIILITCPELNLSVFVFIVVHYLIKQRN